MSIVLQAHSLSHSVGRRQLFSELDLAIDAADRLGLVGYNGSGKSTLLDLLAGELESDSGHVTRIKGLITARVEQFLPERLAGETLRDIVSKHLNQEQSWLAEMHLSRLGFSDAQMQQTAGSLNGGAVNRLMLARALVCEPNLLLLDEPTNHLDTATLALFERVLAGFNGALLVVSHDRAFLDCLCPTTLVLRDQKLYRFELGYTDARKELQRMDVAAAARRSAEEKKIAQVRASATRLASWGSTYDNEDLARRARSMFKRVERMEDERTFVSKGSPLDLDLSVAGSKSKRMLTLENAVVQVPGNTLFTVEDSFLRPGERVAVLGHNGVGKTTLIKSIISQFDASGVIDSVKANESRHIRVSPQAKLGYYDQELSVVTDGATGAQETLFEFVGRDIKRDDQGITTALVAAGFAFEAHNTRVSELSGGERARALFARLSMLQPNLLILDEPTNHIDIEGREQLERQLLESAAAVLFTSHDREFVRTIAQRFWIIEKGCLVEDVSAEAFFARAADGPGALQDSSTERSKEIEARAAAHPTFTTTADEDALLERIDRLETLLAEDEARKTKFQKPKLQLAWRTELARLNARLDEL